MKYVLSSIEGLNNRTAPEDIFSFDRFGVGRSQAVAAVNVDFDPRGNATRRSGFTLRLAGETHSMWASPDGETLLCIRNGVLGTLDSTMAFTVLGTVSDRHMVYDQAPDGTIYATNGAAMYALRDGVLSVLERAGEYRFDPLALPAIGEGTDFDAPPPGEALCVAGAFMFVASGNVIWRSQAWAYEQFDMSEDYQEFSERVTMVRGMDDGLYVGTEKEIYFFPLVSSLKKLRRVCAFGAVYGTDVICHPEDFSIEGLASGKVVAWESQYGKMLGTDAGNVYRMTYKDVAYTPGAAGASLVKYENGNARHVTVFRDPQPEGSNMRTTDTAEAIVIRKGTPI